MLIDNALFLLRNQLAFLVISVPVILAEQHSFLFILLYFFENGKPFLLSFSTFCPLKTW